MGFSSSYIKFLFKNLKQRAGRIKINSFNSLFFVVFAAISLISLIIGGVFAAKPALLFDKGLSTAELQKAGIMMLLLTLSTALGFFCARCLIAILRHLKNLFF
ncbi:MAG: hypothetical protein L6V88_09410 [Anaerotruncus sp.]|nr:MAG: hypothetical protein L6V88_09410 [Anaerotruncus sp.]